MKFKELSQYFEKIEHTSSRLEITEHLAVLFKNLSESEIDKTTYLLQGRLTPLYKRLDFGVAEKMVIKSAINALQIDRTAFLHQNQTIGDIGKTIEYFKKTHENLLQYEKGLSVLEVYNMLLAIAQANGTGSQEIKLQRIAELIQRLDPLSTRYISRIVTGVMRLGFSDMTVLDAPHCFTAARVLADSYTNITINIYADNTLYHTQTVTNKQPFRLPRNGRYRVWQVEVIGVDVIREVAISETVTIIVTGKQIGRAHV